MGQASRQAATFHFVKVGPGLFASRVSPARKQLSRQKDADQREEYRGESRVRDPQVRRGWEESRRDERGRRDDAREVPASHVRGLLGPNTV